MHPNDFRLRSLYGVGLDWPINYDELESYYSQAEEIMQISGDPASEEILPRSKPFPQPPHKLTDPDILLRKTYGNFFFAQPTARPTTATAKRPRCCASGVCGHCPINSKFTILNEMIDLYRDPRVTLLTEAEAISIETAASKAIGLTYFRAGRQEIAKGDLIALGANAIFNPILLERSGIAHPLLGKRLHEQRSVTYTLDLGGIDNFQGSTSITGHGYMLYDGSHRKEMAGCLIETMNIPNIRTENGKWRQRLEIKFIFEDLPSEKNHVAIDGVLNLPKAHFEEYSDYSTRALREVDNNLGKLLKTLPIERVVKRVENKTENHILGTTLMGNDPISSIVDKNLTHHVIRNLLLLGGSVFPTGSPANPTLTICALSLRAADVVR
ncbi:MAG TPA: GMC oxidoreductase [Oligoflexia bacterium]|nr:GMC oxidoreductase [Oligoflexia bacterium]